MRRLSSSVHNAITDSARCRLNSNLLARTITLDRENLLRKWHVFVVRSNSGRHACATARMTGRDSSVHTPLNCWVWPSCWDLICARRTLQKLHVNSPLGDKAFPIIRPQNVFAICTHRKHCFKYVMCLNRGTESRMWDAMTKCHGTRTRRALALEA